MTQQRLLSEKERNIIRGKAMVGHATITEMLSVFAHYDLIEEQLDELDLEDTFGTEGWRHRMAIPGED